jgi:hypothetical protein
VSHDTPTEWITWRGRVVMRLLIPYVYLDSLWCFWPQPLSNFWWDIRRWWRDGRADGKRRADILRGIIALPDKPQDVA